MRTRSLSLVAGLAIAGLVGTGTSAVAQPIDKGHFHDVFTDDPYDCDGLPAQDSGDISGNFVLNQRGSSPFPYYRESVHGTFVTTNLLTGGTFTQVFASVSQDHVITDTVTAPSPSWSTLPAAGGPTTSSASSCQGPRQLPFLLRHRLPGHPR